MKPTSKNTAHFIFISAFSISVLFVNLDFAHAMTLPETPPPSWKEGNYGATLNSEFFSTHANYDDVRGSFTKLPNGQQFSAFENRLKARYATSDSTSWFLGT